jgi:molybdopterin-dependent oxidoreductase alpha subunit
VATTDDDRRAQPPVDNDHAHAGHPTRSAAGVTAILETFKFGLRQMGAARTASTYLKVNQKDGFDCQSCAWPSPDRDRHTVEFCENGAKAMASEATLSRADPAFFAKWSIDALAEQTDAWLEQQGRLTHPMVLREEQGRRHYEPTTWDEAFALIARELRALDSPDEASFYTSGRASNEAAFLYQLFARQFGTNNLPDCSNMCHESSGVAMKENIGVGKATVTLDDFEQTDTIFIIGQNPGTNHPRMLTSLQRAKHNGARIVAINPFREPGLLRVKNPNPGEYRNKLAYVPAMLGSGTPLADLYLQVRVNGDVALLKGIMKSILERHPTAVDRQFLSAFTNGYEAFAADLAATSWDGIVEASGIDRPQIDEAADIAAQAKKMICCWAMGLTQHRNAVDTIQEVVNLLLLGGHIGRPGAGACCVRGHSNVQGDRTVGISHSMPKEFNDALAREFRFTPPARAGLDVVETIKAMHDGRVKVFVALGGNFLSASPDTLYTADALRSCGLTVQVSTKLNRGHLVTGKQALILPCLGRSERDVQATGEQFVTVEDSMSVVNPSRGHLDPASVHLRSEPWIVAGLANATLGAASTIDWRWLADDYDRIRDHISHVVAGFEDFNARIKKDVFYLPNAARERVFKTATGKAQFLVHEIPQHDIGPGEFLMMSVRSHDQFNTTIYGLDDRYRGIHGGRRVVFLHERDIADAGLVAGQIVDLVNDEDGRERIAAKFKVVAYSIPRRCAATYYPEANVLVPIGSVAKGSNTPASKSVRIRIRPHAS